MTVLNSLFAKVNARSAAFAALCAVGFVMVPGAQAAPVAGIGDQAGVGGGAKIEQARTYCYNTRTGEFKHWGPCTNMFRVCNWRGCYLERRYW
jgi:hypothetical protein